MRHRNIVKKLGRTAAHRKATMANLASALLQHKHIETTEAKARVTRRFAERLITLAKQGTLHARRIAFQRLKQKSAVKALFDEIAPRFKDRNGGYTRMVKLGRRSGDGAPVAVLELVGFETAVKKQKDREARAEAKKEQEKKKQKASEKAEKAEEAQKEKKAEKKKEEKKKEEKKSEEKPKPKEKEKKADGDKDKKTDKKEKK
ncbi:MAG: 50S ribosomal protein L17 [bacterium]|nr:50S ribosomal protein L17 [bacterium]